jgi:hypothetical protein
MTLVSVLQLFRALVFILVAIKRNAARLSALADEQTPSLNPPD